MAASISPPSAASIVFDAKTKKREYRSSLSFPAPFPPTTPSRRNQFTRTQRFARSWCLDVARQLETDRSNPPVLRPTVLSFLSVSPRGTSVKNRHGYRNSYGVNKRNGDRVVSRVAADRLPGDVDRSTVFQTFRSFPSFFTFHFCFDWTIRLITGIENEEIKLNLSDLFGWGNGDRRNAKYRASHDRVAAWKVRGDNELPVFSDI